MLFVVGVLLYFFYFFFFKQKTAYEMRISDWSSDVCSSDLASGGTPPHDFDWDFGDGSSGSGATTSYSYSVKGSYNVTLTLTDSANDTRTVSRLDRKSVV